MRRCGGCPEEGNGSLIALFAESEDNDLDMVTVLRKDADSAIDRYDNDLHAAYEDITVELFADDSGEMHWGLRESFKEQILGYGSVREQIHEALDKARLQKTEA